MDDLTTQGAAAAFQAEDAEHVVDVDERTEILVPECFQDEDSERSAITRPAPHPGRPGAAVAPGPS